MLKRYYTLQEAANYLGEKTGESRLSIPDLLEIVGDGRLRICALYSGSITSYWRQLFGRYDFWAFEGPFPVRGYFRVCGADEIQIGRLTISFRLLPILPVEIKAFGFCTGDLMEAFVASVAELATLEPTPAKLKQVAKERGVVLPESEYKHFETHVEFGGFSPATGWPEVETVEVSIDECLIPKEDLDDLLVGGQPNKTLGSINAERLKDDRYAVPFKKLNLHHWPLIKGENQTLYDAVNRSSPWVLDAIKSKSPKLVYPAELAFLLQNTDKPSDLYANAKVLGVYLANNFPKCLPEYEAKIELDQD